MNRIVLISFGALLSLQAASPLGEYQVILDRELFGLPVPASTPVPTPPPAPAAPGWANEFRMTMMSVDPISGRSRVGLQNLKDQSAILIMENDSFESDYKLLEVNKDAGTATIAFNGSPHRFRFEDGPVIAPTPVPQQRGRFRGRRPQQQNNNNASRQPRPQAAAPTPKPTPRFRTRAELQAHLQNVQVDAIRTGKPPIPVQLTPQNDAMLVSEGHLPAQQ